MLKNSQIGFQHQIKAKKDTDYLMFLRTFKITEILSRKEYLIRLKA